MAWIQVGAFRWQCDVSFEGNEFWFEENHPPDDPRQLHSTENNGLLEVTAFWSMLVWPSPQQVQISAKVTIAVFQIKLLKKHLPFLYKSKFLIVL